MRKERVLRKPETQDKYDQYKAEKRLGCAFCFKDGVERKILKKYKYWFITENLFPYDAVYSRNDMLVPARHFEWAWDINEQERLELMEIRKELAEGREYDELLENFPTTKTQIHYHLHLLAF